MNTANIFVERSFDPPIDLEGFYDLALQSSGCLQTHRVEWQQSLLVAGGRNLICHFQAADAESVRIALRQAGSVAAKVWAGTLHEALESTEANVLVTRSFVEPVSLESIQAIEDAAGWCLESHKVRFVRTFFSQDRRRMLCLYQAPDAESVRLAQLRIGMPIEEVLPFRTMRFEHIAHLF